MTNNDARRDIPVSPLETLSDYYFDLADESAQTGNMSEADYYWQLGARFAHRETSDD